MIFIATKNSTSFSQPQGTGEIFFWKLCTCVGGKGDKEYRWNFSAKYGMRFLQADEICDMADV